MLIRCADCIGFKLEKLNDYCKYEISRGATRIRECPMCGGRIEEHKERYRIAEALYRAVLERLLDDKNTAKGNKWREQSYGDLLDLTQDELLELLAEVYPNNRRDTKRIVEEAADAGAFLAMIVDKALTLKSVNSEEAQQLKKEA